jgi:tetratricopeptide (TPR) repeat protein
MLLNWLDARDATRVGAALADDFVMQKATGFRAAPQDSRDASGVSPGQLQKLLNKFLQRVDREARVLELNLFKRAKLANSFKWRLLEKGVEAPIVNELTRALVLRLSAKQARTALLATPAGASTRRPALGTVQAVLQKGNEDIARGAYTEAIESYRDVLNLDARNAIARNNLGAALCKLGHYRQAEDQFRRATLISPGYADAQCNLGTVLRWEGRTVESEMPLRRALKLKPTHVDAHVNLSATLLLLGRLPEAKRLLEKVLKMEPRNVAALVGLGQIAGPEGRLGDAETLFKRALEVDPKAYDACAGLVWLRRMTPADGAWLKHAEEIAGGGLAPLEEATIRYAIGKYCDDVGDYWRAFRSFQRANNLQKMSAEPYDRDAATRLVDDMKRVYTRETLSRAHNGAADSERPVFVVGMPRSGTSLVEQIIASHRAVSGAGELGFWSDAMRRHETTLRHEVPGEPLTRKLAAAYLRVLAGHSSDALRVVDKTPFNSEYLGVIHSVFPRARVIYLRRDPIDSCLSCYFRQFPQDINFAMDLSDLAHYYGEHRRLVEHWRSVLPSETFLDVPYAALVADQETWTRKIVDFLGVEWDERCLDFHKTDRTVLTASYWQVRQKLYHSSIGRWRNYKDYVGPLLGLTDADS